MAHQITHSVDDAGNARKVLSRADIDGPAASA